MHKKYYKKKSLIGLIELMNSWSICISDVTIKLLNIHLFFLIFNDLIYKDKDKYFNLIVFPNFYVRSIQGKYRKTYS